jgi:hypothetical protein
MAAGVTYEKIATTTLSSTASDITFSSISGTYTDIVLSLYHSSSATTGLIYLELNSDSTNNNYSNVRMIADSGGNSSDISASANNVNQRFISWGRTERAITIVHFNNYSNTTATKTLLIRNSNVSGQVTLASVLWRNNNAITQIKIINQSSTFTTGTIATLYGIKAA